MMDRLSNIARLALLPLLLAVYPALFHYANNVLISLLPSLLRMLLLHSLLALGLYLLFLIPYRQHAIRAAISTFIFLVFFHTYGILYSYLLKLDIIQIEHYTLLPLFVLIAIYTSWLVVKIGDAHLQRLWTSGTLILSIIVVFNIIRIAPHELGKAQQTALAATSSASEVDISSLSAEYPDIYYIVLDEFSGFEPMRQYWNYHGVDDFKQYLEDRGFFVAEQTHGLSQVTLYELATRLNYEKYPCCREYRTYFAAIADSQVMRFLKTKRYTTVTFDQTESVIPADLPVQADYSYSNAPDSARPSSLLDDFGILVINNTMLRVFSNIYEPLIVAPGIEAHKNMLFFTLDKMKDLNEIPSPKFVYVHLLLPHMPFIFDQHGTVIATNYNTNWNDYLGNYIYSISYTQEMIENIFSQADPKRPPIIILQSDHGARNQIYNGNEDALLEDFPEEYKTWILYTLYIPGYDTSSLPQDINPINTFPIIFNYLFDANVPLQ